MKSVIKLKDIFIFRYTKQLYPVFALIEFPLQNVFLKNFETTTGLQYLPEKEINIAYNNHSEQQAGKKNTFRKEELILYLAGTTTSNFISTEECITLPNTAEQFWKTIQNKS